MNRKVDQLIDEIMNQQHTEEGWFDLQRRVTDFLLNEATPEEDEYFVDSGAGESLDMICSGFIYFKDKKSEVD